MTTIEKLYYGQIHPHEKLIDPESRFAVLQDLLLSSDEDLERLLPENCEGAYRSFKDAYDELHATAQVEAFADGFSLGLRLGIESYGRETRCGKDGKQSCQFWKTYGLTTLSFRM